MRSLLRLRLFAIVAILLLSFGCAQAGPARTDNFEPVSQQSPAPWTGRSVPTLPDDFRFVIMADRTGGMRPGVFEAAAGKVNLLRPDFVMSVGDYITGYSEDASEVDRQWNEFDAIVHGLDMPFFYVPGNHDVTTPVEQDRWRQRLGASYYHFIYKDVLFLCLNTQDGKGESGFIGTDQAAYAVDVLARNAGVRWTFVFMHQPLWRGGRGGPRGLEAHRGRAARPPVHRLRRPQSQLRAVRARRARLHPARHHRRRAAASPVRSTASSIT